MDKFCHEGTKTLSGCVRRMIFGFSLKTTSAQKKSQVVTNLGFVPEAGIEPAHPKIHDFESCASTNSATQATKSLFANITGSARQSVSRRRVQI